MSKLKLPHAAVLSSFLDMCFITVFIDFTGLDFSREEKEKEK